MANGGVLRNSGDLELAGFRLALGLGRFRLDEQSSEHGTHRGGSSEDVERDLEAVRERSAAESSALGVGVHVMVRERRAIVVAAATPIAPPICWLVLINPEAIPASAGRTQVSAPIATGMKTKASPSPRTMKPGNRSRK